MGKNEAVLEWDQLPVDVQNGFIRNYTIFYKTSAGNETGTATLVAAESRAVFFLLKVLFV